MFEPRHLKAYLALVKCMHFGRAAEMLGISQPTLSQQIRMLEEAVGAPLINRSNRTMELTPVGRVFAEDAQQILTLMERAKRNAEDILSGEEAEVKLGVCPGTISSGFLINLLAESRRRWPRIKVLTEVSPPTNLAARLSKGQIDIYAGLTTGVDFPQTVPVRSSQSGMPYWQFLGADWHSRKQRLRNFLRMKHLSIWRAVKRAIRT